MKMDWSKTKSLFIVTFLILNIFLGYQLIQKRDSSQLDILTEAEFAERLATEKITHEALPNAPKDGPYVSGKVKFFTEDDIINLKNQNPNIENPTILQSVFVEPIKLTNLTDTVKLTQIVTDNIISGDSYVLWNIDEESNRVIFLQKYKDQVIFNQFTNISGILILQLNEDNNIVSYQQTLIIDFEEHEKEDILTATETIEILFNNKHLKYGSHISKMEYGYYPLVPLSESQLLTPTWHIVIDDNVDIFVNAIEGQIIAKTE